jgi:hypothetical protein
MQDHEDDVVLLSTCEQDIQERFAAHKDMIHWYNPASMITREC